MESTLNGSFTMVSDFHLLTPNGCVKINNPTQKLSDSRYLLSTPKINLFMDDGEIPTMPVFQRIYREKNSHRIVLFTNTLFYLQLRSCSFRRIKLTIFINYSQRIKPQRLFTTVSETLLI